MTAYRFFECPHCGKTYFSIGTSKTENGVPIYTCSRCLGKLKENEFRKVQKRLVEFLCEKCSGYIPNVSENRCNIDRDLLCPKCHQIVAYGPRPVHVSQVRAISEDIIRKSQAIRPGLFFIDARSRDERAKLRYLNDIAQQEDIRFRGIQRNFKGHLIFSEKTLLGYLSWNRTADHVPVIRQLFIIPGMRRKGLGTILVRQFVKKTCSDRSDKHPPFTVESPNEASMRLIAKLGYEI